jgi:hypothetical protein
MSQYLSARYTTNAGQLVANGGVAAVIDFEDKVFDDPGTDRVTTGAWVFTANRYMKLRVSSKIEFDSDTNWAVGDFAELSLYKNAVLYAILDYKMMPATVGLAFILGLGGSTTIEMNNGDVFNVRIRQQSGVGQNLDNTGNSNYVDIEEI